MNRHRTNTRAAAFVAAAIVIVLSYPAGATVIDFNGIPAGSIVGGAAGGDPVPAAPFTEFTISCINNGGGPNSAIVFVSASLVTSASATKVSLALACLAPRSERPGAP